ncbi:MAG: hypothetical protein QGD94_12645, partial [Planctomycetia bacterium]|nr:hypothetical protein [Planctomycetia bacterium]
MANRKANGEPGRLTEAQLRVAAEVASQMGALADPEAIRQLVLERSMEIFHCSAAAISLWDDVEKVLKPAAALGDGHLLQTPEYHNCRAVSEHALARREAAILAGPEAGKAAAPLGSIMAVPRESASEFATGTLAAA